MTEESKIRDTADAVKGIVEAVPIYQDVLQPAAKEIGAALHVVAKTIHIALAPVSVLVWGYDQIKDFVSTKVAEKLRKVPPENITTPKLNVAGPLLESLRYTGHEETLSDMYANLLAASMDSRTASGAHPSFVEIIRQLTSDEARLVKLFSHDRAFPLVTVGWRFKKEKTPLTGEQSILVNFSLLGYEAKCEFPHLTPIYLDNLCRLRLIRIPSDAFYTSPGVYDELEKHQDIIAVKNSITEDEKMEAFIERKAIIVTELGKQFCRICVFPHDQNGMTSK